MSRWCTLPASNCSPGRGFPRLHTYGRLLRLSLFLAIPESCKMTTLPRELTSYDFAKCFAVIFMIVDHIGYHFFPEENWWRLLGRFCVPVWFFLIGYAKSRDLGWKLWVGGLILLAANFPAGQFILPLNILFSIIFIRLVLDPVMAHALKGKREFWAVNVMLLFLVLPTQVLAEYGTQGLILAIFGYLVRNKDNIKEGKTLLAQYTLFATGGFVIMQSLLFGFVSELQFFSLSVGILIVTFMLLLFKPMSYPRLTKALPRPAVWMLQIGGRRTLEIYVLHLLLFKALAVKAGYFKLFDWTITTMV
jgi:hypothetical protein